MEQRFCGILKRMGIPYRIATREEQIYKHFDFVTKKGTIDVKAMKNINRFDNNPQNELIWVEFKNVRGDKGWLCSEVDFIAFEQLKSFLIVKRSSLLKKAKSLCDLVNITRQGGMNALYRGYQREGRKDLIAMIKLSDILSLQHKHLPK